MSGTPQPTEFASGSGRPSRPFSAAAQRILHALWAGTSAKFIRLSFVALMGALSTHPALAQTPSSNPDASPPPDHDQPAPEASVSTSSNAASEPANVNPEPVNAPAPLPTPSQSSTPPPTHPSPEDVDPRDPRNVPTLDEAPSVVGALISDVERIIAAFEDEGWFIDSEAYAQIAPVLLESVCRTPADQRLVALHILEHDARVDPERLFLQSAGELTDEVEDALSARRRWTALKLAMARSNECPFWSKPSADFTGRQTTRDKWAIHAEGGGLVSLGRTHERYALGGGGSGRLLIGRGVGDDLSLLVGAEVGGGADLNPPGDDAQFTLKYTAAVPLMVRSRSVAWHYDFELAPIALLEAENTNLSWGARGGFAIGLSTLRVRDFLPWAGAAITLEHYFPSGGRQSSQVLRGGLRVGFRWLP